MPRGCTFCVSSSLQPLLPTLRQGAGLGQFYALPGTAAAVLCNYHFMPCSASIQGIGYLVMQSASEKVLTVLFKFFGCMHIVSHEHLCLTENQELQNHRITEW